MTAAAELIHACKQLKQGEFYTTQEIATIYWKYGGNKHVAPQPTDYCYNSFNAGLSQINFERLPHLFEKVGKGQFIYWGENYAYSGQVFHTNHEGKITKYGYWKKGVFFKE